MKFIHTGDIHLGAHPENKKEWATKRGDEIWESFEKINKENKDAASGFAYYCRRYVS